MDDSNLLQENLQLREALEKAKYALRESMIDLETVYNSVDSDPLSRIEQSVEESKERSLLAISAIDAVLKSRQAYD